MRLFNRIQKRKNRSQKVPPKWASSREIYPAARGEHKKGGPVGPPWFQPAPQRRVNALERVDPPSQARQFARDRVGGKNALGGATVHFRLSILKRA